MRIALILLLCFSVALGDQISQEVVGASGDDGGVLRNGGALVTNATTQAVGVNIVGNAYWIYARFQSVPIPVGATIDTVIYTVVASSNSSATVVSASLFCADTSDAANPADSTNLFTCAKTTATYYWSNIPSWTGGTSYRWGGSTGNVKDPFVELFARSDWVSGNDVLVIVKDSGTAPNNRTRIIAMEDHATYSPPTLDIYYTVAGVPHVYHGVAGIGRLHSPQGNSVLHKK